MIAKSSAFNEMFPVDPKCLSEAEKDAVISAGDALALQTEITELAIEAWALVQ